MLIVCPSLSYPSQICQRWCPVTMSQSSNSATLWHIAVGPIAKQSPCCSKKLYNLSCDLSCKLWGSLFAIRYLTFMPPMFIALTSHPSSSRLSLNSLSQFNTAQCNEESLTSSVLNMSVINPYVRSKRICSWTRLLNSKCLFNQLALKYS